MTSKPQLICRVLGSQGDTYGDHRGMTSSLVEGYRRYVAFVYLYGTAQRHVTEGNNFMDSLGMTLCLFSLLPLMTRRSCVI